MHWASILFALGLTTASCWLVVFGQREVWAAFGAVGVVAVLLIGGLMVLLLVVTPRSRRHLLLAEIWQVARNDLQKIFRVTR